MGRRQTDAEHEQGEPRNWRSTRGGDLVVLGVADDGSADRLQMGSDLIRAVPFPAGPSSRASHQEDRSTTSRCVTTTMRRAPPTTTRSAARWSRPSGASMRPVRDDGQPSTSRYCRLTERSAIIALSAGALPASRRRRADRGVAVEPMDDARPAGVVPACEQIAELLDGLLRIAPGPMHQQAGGLVDDGEMLVAGDQRPLPSIAGASLTPVPCRCAPAQTRRTLPTSGDGALPEGVHPDENHRPRVMATSAT